MKTVAALCAAIAVAVVGCGDERAAAPSPPSPPPVHFRPGCWYTLFGPARLLYCGPGTAVGAGVPPGGGSGGHPLLVEG